MNAEDIHNAHKNCPRPQLKKGSYEYEAAKANSFNLYRWCVHCGGVPDEFHHIVRRREGKTWGGCDATPNMVPMCRNCHTLAPVRPIDIVNISELPEFHTLTKRIIEWQNNNPL